MGKVASVIRIARRFGLRVRITKLAPRRQWTGRDDVLRTTYLEQVHHELAHALICAAIEPERLFLVNFGLGEGPEDGRDDFLDIVFAARNPNGEEHLAWVLGMWFARCLGDDWRRAWVDGGAKDWVPRGAVARALRDLKTLGLLFPKQSLLELTHG